MGGREKEQLPVFVRSVFLVPYLGLKHLLHHIFQCYNPHHEPCPSLPPSLLLSLLLPLLLLLP